MEIDNSLPLIKMIELIIDEKIPLVSNLANISSLLKNKLNNVSWAGFYLTDEERELLFLGPFQGGLACTIIPKGKGVCGVAYLTKTSQLVENVHNFKGHIACSSTTNSELVVPIIKEGKVYGVIDLDSDLLNNFSREDQFLLEEIARKILFLF